MNSIQVSATIVTYENNPEELNRAIESFLMTNLNVIIYIIDNSPTDYLKTHITTDRRVIYRFMGCNKGFGAGHNEIMRNTNLLGTYHLILNPDISFKQGTIEGLYYYMEHHYDVGNVMPKVIYPNGDLQYLCKLLPTPIDWIGRLIIPFQAIKDKINDKFEMHFADYNKCMNVPYLSGCFMFLRTSVIKEIGLFDSHIFMYGEDTDLNRRIHAKYKTMYNPDVTIIHRHEQGSHKNLHLMWIHIKAAIYYFNKWGWFIDKERKEINRKTINEYSVKPIQ